MTTLPDSMGIYDMEAKILRQERRKADVYAIALRCPWIAEAARPGQFVQLELPEGTATLRRPLGIAGHRGKEMTLFYRVVGKGTRRLAACRPGEMLRVLGPLGHGFSEEAKRPLLVGGGMGLSPLLSWARAFPGKADVLMGGRTADELFWQWDFEGIVQETYLATDDGSLGIKGFAVSFLPDLLRQGDYDMVMACGPEPMMRAAAEIARRHGLPCQVSLERRMACGLGACLSCSIDGRGGKRYKVCKDGPVFRAEDVF